MQDHSFSHSASRSLNSSSSPSDCSNLNGLHSKSSSHNTQMPGLAHLGSRLTALNVEFVAKPNEAHKIHSALPSAIDGALGEVAGFAGSFVMIANYEARLVTVVTLWSGEDRLQRPARSLHGSLPARANASRVCTRQQASFATIRTTLHCRTVRIISAGGPRGTRAVRCVMRRVGGCAAFTENCRQHFRAFATSNLHWGTMRRGTASGKLVFAVRFGGHVNDVRR